MNAQRCACKAPGHELKLVVLTGGPGAGKTALLELVRKHFCEHIVVLPEAAGIVFGGGFPRGSDNATRRAAQRAIYHVERELEACVKEQRRAAVALCDRGTVDSVAYWPGPADELWREVGTTLEIELERYTTVIHMRTPGVAQGYDNSNPLRIESADEAHVIDEAIALAWSAHPRRFTVESGADFFDKMRRALELIRLEVPACCRTHAIGAKGEKR